MISMNLTVLRAARRATGVLAAGVTLMSAPPAGAQTDDTYPPLVWTAREFQAGAGSGTDEGMDIAFWPKWPVAECDHTETTSWIFVAGYVTESTGATRFATYKYDAGSAVNPPPWAATPQFYPLTVPATPETHQVVAMAVDCHGNVYVTGKSKRPGATDLDIVTIAYDKNLQPLWTPPERRYNFAANGDDVPTDIAVNPNGDAIVVVGTSWNGANDDIVTIAYDATDGSPPAVAWPDVGFGPAIRRYDNGGADRSVEVDGVRVVQNSDSILFLDAIILGTSFDQNTLDDYVLIRYGPSPTTPVNWIRRYDPYPNQNDIATGLSVSGDFVYATGYSPHRGGFDAPIQQDYTTMSCAYGDGALRWEHQWDLAGGDDYPADIQAHSPGQIAVTGRVTNGSGFDIGTLILGEDGLGQLASSWTHVLGEPGATDDRGIALATGNDFLTWADPYAACQRTLVTGNVDFRTARYTSTAPSIPPYFLNWHKIWQGTLTGGKDAPRAIAVGKPIGSTDTGPSVYVVGTSFKTGQGQDFVTLRYRQN